MDLENKEELKAEATETVEETAAPAEATNDEKPARGRRGRGRKQKIETTEEKVDNHDNMESMVDPNKMMGAMNDYAAMYKNMMMLKQRLNIACYAVNAKNARYVRSPQNYQ